MAKKTALTKEQKAFTQIMKACEALGWAMSIPETGKKDVKYLIIGRTKKIQKICRKLK